MKLFLHKICRFVPVMKKPCIDCDVELKFRRFFEATEEYLIGRQRPFVT